MEEEHDLISSMWRYLVPTGEGQEQPAGTVASSPAMGTAWNHHQTVAIAVEDHCPRVYQEMEPTNYWTTHHDMMSSPDYPVAIADELMTEEEETSVEMQQALSDSLQQVKDTHCIIPEEDAVVAMDYWNQLNTEQDFSKVEVETKAAVDGKTQYSQRSRRGGTRRSDKEKNIFVIRDEDDQKGDSSSIYPQFVSIGLYTRLHGRDDLEYMQYQKWELYKMHESEKNISWANCMPQIQAVEEDVKKYYVDGPEEDEGESDGEQLKCLIYDACFILVYFRILHLLSEPGADANSAPELQAPPLRRALRKRDYFYFYMPQEYVMPDICLMDNQIPFIVIQIVYDASSDKDDRDLLFLRKETVKFLKEILLHRYSTAIKDDGKEVKEFNHFLHYFHMYFTPSVLLENEEGRHSPLINKRMDDKSWRRATVLEETNSIILKKKDTKKPPSSLLDIEFDDKGGVLRIPTLTVDRYTEPLFRNILAFEQALASSDPSNCYRNYFTAYVKFMGDLMMTSADAALLAKRKIIQNNLGKDEDISTLFIRLKKRTSHFSLENTYLTDTFFKLEEHCESRGRMLWADLKKKYLGTPWLIVGLVAGTITLVCTILGTAYTIKGSN